MPTPLRPASRAAWAYGAGASTRMVGGTYRAHRADSGDGGSTVAAIAARPYAATICAARASSAGVSFACSSASCASLRSCRPFSRAALNQP